MFKCKVCLEKDKRLADLQDQILYLKSMTLPFEQNMRFSQIEEEANHILQATAGDAPPEKEPVDNPEKHDADSIEADKILMGSYEFS